MEEKLRILCEKNIYIMQQVKILNFVILLFSVPEPILLSKEDKINKQLVMFRNNQRNSRPFVTLKVGHNIYITKETLCSVGVNNFVKSQRL
jgi:hypothetical protein